MCGRFTQHYTWQEIHELYGLVGAARNVEPRYNIAPTSAIDVVLLTIDGPALVLMRWGLIPSWWKKTAKDAPSTFNARAETEWRSRNRAAAAGGQRSPSHVSVARRVNRTGGGDDPALRAESAVRRTSYGGPAFRHDGNFGWGGRAATISQEQWARSDYSTISHEGLPPCFCS
jgi:hypothetical protein